jgi:hypothetical protein
MECAMEITLNNVASGLKKHFQRGICDSAAHVGCSMGFTQWVFRAKKDCSSPTLELVRCNVADRDGVQLRFFLTVAGVVDCDKC